MLFSPAPAGGSLPRGTWLLLIPELSPTTLWIPRAQDIPVPGEGLAALFILALFNMVLPGLLLRGALSVFSGMALYHQGGLGVSSAYSNTLLPGTSPLTALAKAGTLGTAGVQHARPRVRALFAAPPPEALKKIRKEVIVLVADLGASHPGPREARGSSGEMPDSHVQGKGQSPTKP